MADPVVTVSAAWAGLGAALLGMVALVAVALDGMLDARVARLRARSGLV